MMDIARKILVTFAIFAKFAILKAVLFKSFLLKLRKELVSKVLLTLHHSLTKKIFFWRLVKGLNFGFSQTYQITLRFVVISQKDFPHLQVQNCSDNLKIRSQSFAFHNLVPRNETVKMSLKHFLFWMLLEIQEDGFDEFVEMLICSETDRSLRAITPHIKILTSNSSH